MQKSGKKTATLPRTGLCLLRKRKRYLKAEIEVKKFNGADIVTASDNDIIVDDKDDWNLENL